MSSIYLVCELHNPRTGAMYIAAPMPSETSPLKLRGLVCLVGRGAANEARQSSLQYSLLLETRDSLPVKPGAKRTGFGQVIC